MSSSIIPRIKPPALKNGDTVGIVAPASNVQRAELEAGCEALRRAGYIPFYLDTIFDKDLYFAGSVQRRARELEEMFVREEVRAIICARGGYGANYLLPELNFEKIKAQPKIFVGYSDITALLTYFSDALGMVTFHGPMAAKDWAHADCVDMPSWHAALTAASAWDINLAGSDAVGLVDGTADGILYGGCLSILVASLGTPYEIRTAGTILFLEDLGEKPYQIDRMLMQLKLAGKFDEVQGIIFGEMLDCGEPGALDYTLQQVVMRILRDLHIPVAFGLKSGHVSSGSITLPFGVPAELSVSKTRVALSYEAATRVL